MFYRDVYPSFALLDRFRAPLGVGYCGLHVEGTSHTADFPPYATPTCRTWLTHPCPIVPLRFDQMQPSYWFQGATPTPRSIHPYYVPRSAFTVVEEWRWQVRVWRFRCDGRLSPRADYPWPTSTRNPVYLRASIRSSVTSYLHTTLAVTVRLLAPRLGTQPPISPIPPFLPHNFRRAEFFG